MRQAVARAEIDPIREPAVGLLDASRGLQHFELRRFAPAADLSEFIELFWVVRWDLRDAPPHTQENLPHPTQHLVIDPAGQTGIFGLTRSRFAYRQSGAGRVIGAKFRPAAFRRFFDRPVSAITDKVVPIADVFGVSDASLEVAIIARADPARMADPIEDMVRKRLPNADPRATEVEAIVALIASATDLYSVADLTRRTGLGVRTLQRLFENYIGIGPKWVIDRYRMIQAVEALNAAGDVNLTALAHALGYFDQAHFSRAFRALTGTSPSSYMRAGSVNP